MFFSKKEIIIIVFLIVTFVTGSGINLYRHIWGKNYNYPNYESDISAYEKEIITVIEKDIAEKKVDSKIDNKRNKRKEQTLCIDINSATKAEFEQLPYIGPVLAKRIIDYRNQVGRFKTLEELIKIKGIGDKRLKKIKPYIKSVN